MLGVGNVCVIWTRVMIPFEKLKTLLDAERFLITNISIARLEANARERSNLAAAEAVNWVRRTLDRAGGVALAVDWGKPLSLRRKGTTASGISMKLRQTAEFGVVH